jgi:serine/threonine protein phosphatase PrpC
MNCPHCNALQEEEGSKFCGECGGLMEVPATTAGASASATPALSANPAQICPKCGAGPTAIAEDGFCNCGTLRKAPARNHFERIISTKCAGVSDIGTHHAENQDYIALGVGNGDEALILLDGVSQSQNSMEGSEVAGDAALASILAQLKAGVTDAQAAVKTAIVAAQTAICKVAYNPLVKDAKGRDIDPAESTIVFALIQGKKIHLAWAGDSRAYWSDKNGVVQLTRDDSWADEQVAAGRMTMEEAMTKPEAHAITNSLGMLANGKDPGICPTVITMNVTGPGRLIICCDGFWNCAEDPKVIAKLIAKNPNTGDALALARVLVNFGRDTVTNKDNVSVIIREF